MQETPVQFLGQEDSPGEGTGYPLQCSSFSSGSDGKESTCNEKTEVRSLGWEDPLEEGMATHSSVLVWRIPTDRGVWQTKVHRVAKSQTHN